MKLHSNFNLFAATHFDASKYIPSPAYGVERFMLDRIGAEKARATTIVKYQPNSKFPTHQHIGGEEFLVLKGTFKDQFGEFKAGTYVRNPVDSEHAPWVDEDGCTIFVKLLQMAENKDETKPLYVNYDSPETPTENTDFGRQIQMYQNDQTGEMVHMCWIEAGKEMCTSTGLGEELFVVAGSVKHKDTEYPEWGWLRFPPSASQETIVAGSEGAQLFRKRGHLTAKALAMEKIQIDSETEAIVQ